MQESRLHWWLVLVVCVVACAARAGMLAVRGSQLHEDRDAYVEIASHLAREGSFAKDLPPHATAYRPPLLPLLIAGILWCHGTSFTLGLIHVALGTLTTGLTFRVGQLLNLKWASAIAAGLVALDPLLLQSTVLAMTETLCATLVVLWCWVLLEFPAADRGIKSVRVWPSLLQGACFGLICLCRPGFLAAAGLVGLWCCVQLLRYWRIGGDFAPLRHLSLTLIWTLAGTVIVLAPWTIRNYVVLGKATPATTHGGYTLLLANNTVFYHEVVCQPWGTVWSGDSLTRWQIELEQQLARDKIRPDDEVSRDKWMYRKACSNIRAEPFMFLRSCLWRGLRFWDVAPRSGVTDYSPILIWGTTIFYALVTCGILIGLCRLNRLEWIVWRMLLLLPLTLWLTHLVYWTDMRMRAPVIPILALLAARACFGSASSTAPDETNVRLKP